MQLYSYFFQTEIKEIYLEYILNQVNATWPQLRLVIIASGKGSVPLGDKTLPDPTLTKVLWRHIVSLGHTEAPTCIENKLIYKWQLFHCGFHCGMVMPCGDMAQVMDHCLTAPSHCQTQCWVVVSKALWLAPEGNFTTDTSDTNH